MASAIINPEEIPDGMTSKQYVWDDFGRWVQHKIAQSPESYVVESFPNESEPWGFYFLESLGPLYGKTVLDIGCGIGRFSVYAAKAGAKVIGIDLQLEVIKAARSIADINGVKCQFQRGNVSKLPLINGSIDIVVGIEILHHLSKPDVITALSEIHRVLREDGKAIFKEPVENSKMFNFMQNLFPAGKKQCSYYRPSCLSSKAWAEYVAKQEDRDMTNKELVEAGATFKRVSLIPFGLLIRLDRFLESRKLRCLLNSIDNYILGFFPFLKRFSRGVLVEYQK
jgi:2-polyprenyl-3-methyl-5-hydroxy-6-metoxy-1,4-benzoquinol methylase